MEAEPELVQTARQRAAAQTALPHYDSSGKLALMELFQSGAVSYRLAGENLARLTAEDAQAAEQAEVALMNSPTHRKNILEPGFNRLVVGMVRDGSGRIVFAQIFRVV